MNVNLFLSNNLISDDLFLKDKNVVIIDILRATSSMTIALANGAKEIIPTDTASTAARIAKGRGNSLLCGERDGKIVEGFNLGNSPFEFTEDAIKDKILVWSTTNGSVSIVKAKHAKTAVLASFLNISAVVDYISKLDGDLNVVCSGKLSNVCIEDVVCAGLLLMKLGKALGRELEGIDDPEQIAIDLCKFYFASSGRVSSKAVQEMLQITEHGKYLSSLGFGHDLEVCSKIDSLPFVPLFRNGVIKLKEVIESEDSAKTKLKKVNLIKDEKDSVKKA
ncbi:MAG: 2-phosphosulfolactate phosphatase [Ignavibacteriae bacterium]|nr:2-phosphosulfolactate phosphatase [Ignavibacteriota bacterium]